MRKVVGSDMRVLLIDIDSTIPNIAMKKIEMYHVNQGDTVVWNMELEKHIADKIYVSCVFDWNKYKCEEWEGIAEIGGSGYSLTTEAKSPVAGKQKCIAALAKKYCVSRQKMVGYFTDKLNCEVVCS